MRESVYVIKSHHTWFIPLHSTTSLYIIVKIYLYSTTFFLRGNDSQVLFCSRASNYTFIETFTFIRCNGLTKGLRLSFKSIRKNIRVKSLRWSKHNWRNRIWRFTRSGYWKKTRNKITMILRRITRSLKCTFWYIYRNITNHIFMWNLTM